MNVDGPASTASTLHERDDLAEVLGQVLVGSVLLLDVQALLNVRPRGRWCLIADAQHGRDAVAREEGWVFENVGATEVKRGRREDPRGRAAHVAGI